MMKNEVKKTYGCSRTTSDTSDIFYVESKEDIMKVIKLAKTESKKISNIGSGKSYGDNFLNDEVSISFANFNKVLNIALKAHKLLNCKGITRSDFKFYKNKFYLLELNTQPGMTDLSLVPEIAAHQNIDFKSLINWMIKDASKKR